MMKEDSYFPLLLEVMTRAYAPYSKFAVGAVVRSTSGALYTGANVENAAYPQGWCAETSALAAMIMAGETRLAEIAVIAAGQDICTPCGGCRQKIREFADPDARVLCYGAAAPTAIYTLGELLPHAFGPDHLL